MNMNRAFYLRNEDRQPQWVLIDAQDKVLGRLATEIADILRGKNKPQYTPHADAGDYVVVINAEKVKLTGNKVEQKTYVRYSGWIGGKKETTVEQMLIKHPTFIVEHAVKGMLPKNKLARQQIRKLKVYVGSEHPHKAQLSK
ncbi:MAG: 50S ribosomal protein L13 [candidate division TM6 bacterium GW2011_GWE2_36_25]|nr:MAG: 50S ribosomal protein L13 [candidate division TM6 bacterium GW2011_GWF2_36_131]KKQ03094.1 MAG: 50S ribosomal protein L13 [candidate division TM6 bacterium GW2011_GWE2_36_25]KKQ18409.1 MAG: 50S ribosomal protein L13 [candidate division TM6 bacterium GW2011_GWA2_36_9]